MKANNKINGNQELVIIKILMIQLKVNIFNYQKIKPY